MSKLSVYEKAKHYQRTGEFLAQEEQEEFINRNISRLQSEYDKFVKKDQIDGLSFEDYLDLARGYWQMFNNFFTESNRRCNGI